MEFVISEQPGAEWDAFVERHTDLIFYTSLWSEVLKKGLGGQPCYMSLRDGGRILCGMPAAIITLCGIRFLYGSFPYGGYVGASALFDHFMREMFSATAFADILYVSPYSPELDACYAKYFKATAEAATRIDLKGKTPKEIQSGFKSSARFRIKKGARLGLEVLRCNDRESFVAAHGLYLQSMRRNKAIARYSIGWFEALRQVLADQGRVTVYLAKHGEVPVSAMVVINSDKGFHFLHIGSSTEYLHLCANDLVVSEVISDAIRAGKDYVDLMFSNPRDINLVRWKEKFGGRTVLLNKHRHVNSPVKYVLWNSAKGIASYAQRFR